MSNKIMAASLGGLNAGKRTRATSERKDNYFSLDR